MLLLAMIIFFDGVCNLCNHFVDFVIRRDVRGKFKFSSLQSSYAKNNLPESLVENMSSVVLLKEEAIYRQSSAALHILVAIDGFYKIFSIFFIVPRPLRDFVYRRIAKSRYSMFGKRDICRIPTAEEQQRFLE